uniref:60S ribosomal protein L29 n=1 Tax=Globodera pallida TaxID=36090 RepID=A0A183C2U3_GLOPA
MMKILLRWSGRKIRAHPHRKLLTHRRFPKPPKLHDNPPTLHRATQAHRQAHQKKGKAPTFQKRILAIGHFLRLQVLCRICLVHPLKNPNFRRQCTTHQQHRHIIRPINPMIKLLGR